MNTDLTVLPLTDRQLLDSLQSIQRGELPTELLRTLQSRGSVVVPGLIEILKSDIANLRAGVDLKPNASFFAFVLLGVIGDPSALPVMIEAISLPDPMINILLGDLIHDQLPLFMVKLSPGNVNVVRDLIANRDLYLYVRWALAGCYLYFVKDGLITREAAATLLEQHLNDEIQYPSYELNAGLALELARLAVPASLETVRRAYDSRNVDEMVVGLGELEKDFAAGETKFAAEISRLRPLDYDVIEELSQWASFRPNSPKVPDKAVPEQKKFQPLEKPVYPRMAVPEKRPGRNDACPCGSGKKYKKCCGVNR